MRSSAELATENIELKRYYEIEGQLSASLNSLLNQTEGGQDQRLFLQAAIKGVETALFAIYTVIAQARERTSNVDNASLIVMSSLAPSESNISVNNNIESKLAPVLMTLQSPPIPTVIPKKKSQPRGPNKKQAMQLLSLQRHMHRSMKDSIQEIKDYLVAVRPALKIHRVDSVYRSLTNTILGVASLHAKATIQNLTALQMSEFNGAFLDILEEAKEYAREASIRYLDENIFHLHGQVAAYVEASIKGKDIESSFKEILLAINRARFGDISLRKLEVIGAFINHLKDHFAKVGGQDLKARFDAQYWHYHWVMLPQLKAALVRKDKTPAESVLMDLSVDSGSNSSSMNSHSNYSNNDTTHVSIRFMKRKEPPEVHKRDIAPNKLPGNGISRVDEA